MEKRLWNKTKIVATIGPASASRDVLKGMILAGADICRINFSHGSYEDVKKIIDNIRDLNNELQANVGILADLQGPKIRIGEMENGGAELKEGAGFYHRKMYGLSIESVYDLSPVSGRCCYRRSDPHR
jgi:pyruvate kinase